MSLLNLLWISRTTPVYRLPFDKLKAELLYPSRVENQDTSPHLIKMAVELVIFPLAKLLDPKKAASN